VIEPELSPRALRSFLVLAQELHFGRAAERLGVAQPALSQQLQRLESTLGVRLIDRSARRVALTDAGAAFLPDAARALDAQERAATSARAAWRGQRGTLRVALMAATPTEAFVQTLRTYALNHPDVTVRIREAPLDRVLAQVADGDADLALLVAHAPPRTPRDVELHPICTENLHVAVGPGHRLLAATSASMGELADERFSLLARGDGAALDVHGLCTMAGFQPTPYAEVHDLATQLAIVATGLCVAIVPESAHRHAPADVTFTPLTDVQPLRWYLAYRDRSASRTLRTFLAILQAGGELQSPTPPDHPSRAMPSPLGTASSATASGPKATADTGAT
jgi:DNA-binding transcriptional LysR family regulator